MNVYTCCTKFEYFEEHDTKSLFIVYIAVDQNQIEPPKPNIVEIRFNTRLFFV